MTGVSFIKRSVDEMDADEVDADDVVLFLEGVDDFGFAELMTAVEDRRPNGYEFFESWVCTGEEF